MTVTSIVTGAAGFIGSHLAGVLIDRGHRVYGIDNLDPYYDPQLKRSNIAAMPPGPFTFINADICQPDLSRIVADIAPDIVFHLAAMPGVTASLADPDRYHAVNVDGLANMLRSTAACDCRQFVFASSSSVYGDRVAVPFSEDDPTLDPISPYAATKCAGERLLHEHCGRGDMRGVALRFFTVFGPRQRPDLAIAQFMHRLLHDEAVPIFGDGNSARDYTYVDDAVNGVIAASDWLGGEPAGTFDVFNIGGGSPVRLVELIERISVVAGRPATVEQRPPRAGDVQRTVADLRKSERVLGYRPTVGLEEGLARQWSWLRRLETKTEG